MEIWRFLIQSIQTEVWESFKRPRTSNLVKYEEVLKVIFCTNPQKNLDYNPTDQWPSQLK
jgi:hypothetical protein